MQLKVQIQEFWHPTVWTQICVTQSEVASLWHQPCNHEVHSVAYWQDPVLAMHFSVCHPILTQQEGIFLNRPITDPLLHEIRTFNRPNQGTNVS